MADRTMYRHVVKLPGKPATHVETPSRELSDMLTAIFKAVGAGVVDDGYFLPWALPDIGKANCEFIVAVDHGATTKQIVAFAKTAERAKQEARRELRNGAEKVVVAIRVETVVKTLSRGE